MASPALTTAESHNTRDATYDQSPHSESPDIQDDVSVHDAADDHDPKPQPLQKRRRVTRACDECRRKKIKCDGKQPCTHCTVYSYGRLFLCPLACRWPSLTLLQNGTCSPSLTLTLTHHLPAPLLTSPQYLRPAVKP
jgi:hypothetical protein